MSRTTTFNVDVQFGDCDPAGIVFFPNYLRWMDAASHSFFAQCGVAPWRELEATRGIVGAPLLELQTKFASPATYPQSLVVSTCIAEWHRKAFVHVHRVMRGDTLLCEGREVRVLATRDAADHDRLRAIPFPDDIRALCQ